MIFPLGFLSKLRMYEPNKINTLNNQSITVEIPIPLKVFLAKKYHSPFFYSVSTEM